MRRLLVLDERGKLLTQLVDSLHHRVLHRAGLVVVDGELEQVEEGKARVLELVFHCRWLVQAQLCLSNDGCCHHEVLQLLGVRVAGLLVALLHQVLAEAMAEV